MSKLKNSNLANYYSKGFKQIQGWCSESAFSTIDLLDSVEINRTGGCCEIGVHHGSFYILLNQTISPSYMSYAIDIFENQSLNIDYSGSGSLAKFKENLEKHDIHKGSNTKIIIGDSTDPALNLEEQIGLGTLRFMSVDGGHRAEHTVNDLHLASRLISNEGVVILDDITNFHWLGVIEGALRFLDTCPSLVPFAIGHNKLYFSKLSFSKFYFDIFDESEYKTKVVEFKGHRLVALQPA